MSPSLSWLHFVGIPADYSVTTLPFRHILAVPPPYWWADLRYHEASPSLGLLFPSWCTPHVSSLRFKRDLASLQSSRRCRWPPYASDNVCLCEFCLTNTTNIYQDEKRTLSCICIPIISFRVRGYQRKYGRRQYVAPTCGALRQRQARPPC